MSPERRSLAGRRVLVTEAGLAQSLAVVRSLAAAGAHVVAGDASARSPAFRSRHVADRFTYPAAETDPNGAVSAIIAAAERHRVELIIPMIDQLLIPWSQRPPRAGPVVAMPSAPALEQARDKAATVAVAAGLGVPVPRTEVVTTVAEAARVAAGMRFPLVLKPQYSHQATADHPMATFAVAFAADLGSVRRLVGSLEGSCAVLVQEYVPGTGCCVELLVHEGRPLAAFQHRRLREVPISGGMSSFRESVDLDPDLLGHASALLEAIEWSGLAMVEFRVGPDGPVLMEINGRPWGSLALPVRSGMDFPRRLAELYLDGPPPPSQPVATEYRRGVRVRNLELELRWIAAVLRQKAPHRFAPLPPRGAALRVALGLLWPGNDFDVQVVNDPRPGVTDLGRALGYLARRARDGEPSRAPSAQTGGLAGPVRSGDRRLP
ncbi:hypothetical protein BH24ACT3_BH24ACT3_13380 [soil metagenome]